MGVGHRGRRRRRLNRQVKNGTRAMQADNDTTTTEMTGDATREPAIYDNSPRSYRNARIAESRRKVATYKELAEDSPFQYQGLGK